MFIKELIVVELLAKEGIFEIQPLEKYKEGGVAWRRERNKGRRRDQLLAMDDSDLLELYRNTIWNEGFTEGEIEGDYY